MLLSQLRLLHQKHLSFIVCYNFIWKYLVRSLDIVLIPNTDVIYLEIGYFRNIVHALVSWFLQIPWHLFILQFFMPKFCSCSLDVEIVFEVFGSAFVSILLYVLIKMTWWIPPLHLFHHLLHLKLEFAKDLLSLILLFIAVKVGQRINLNLFSTLIHRIIVHFRRSFWCFFDWFLKLRFEVKVIHVIMDICEMVDVLLRRITDNLLLSANKFSESAFGSPGILRVIFRHTIDLFESVFIRAGNVVEKCVSVEFLRIFEWLVFFGTQNGSVGSTILLNCVGTDFHIAGAWFWS